MSDSCEWLPPLMSFCKEVETWESYLDRVYQKFKKDFIEDGVTCLGSEVYIHTNPMVDGREQAFFHVASTGDNPNSRIYDPERCERITWVKPILENAETLKVWVEERVLNRGPRMRINIATPSFDYLAVLDRPKSNRLTLVTAFHIEHSHQRRKKSRAYSDYMQKNRGRT